jgi:imidazolonepropionase-like amidohydrolase
MKACRLDMEAGADFIKYMASGSVMNPGGKPALMICAPAEIKALTEAAESLGTYVAAHCHSKEAIMECIKNGIRTIEHASFIDSDCIDLILKNGNQVSIIPTIGVVYSLVNNLAGNVPDEYIENINEMLSNLCENLKLAYNNGIKIITKRICV